MVEVPLQHLMNENHQLTMAMVFLVRLTLVPTLVSSLDAPTTAYFGYERCTFFCSSVPGMM